MNEKQDLAKNNPKITRKIKRPKLRRQTAEILLFCRLLHINQIKTEIPLSNDKSN